MSNLTPKISIVVVTYNSGKYVTETLDSIASQSYTGEIQLIVSDDCSQDDTVLICKNWLRDHKDRFPDATIISSTSNTGISGNYNRALKEVNGLWVKYIAGDDILTPDCIREFVAETFRTDDKFIMCSVIPFDSTGDRALRMKARFLADYDVSGQEKALSNSPCVIEGPSFFLETATLREMDGFDETYPYVEDWPLAMKYVFNGYHIHICYKGLVRYREYQSVSKEGSAYYNKFYWCVYASLNDWRMRIARRDRKYLSWWHARVQRYLLDIPKKGKINICLRYILIMTDIKRFSNSINIK